MKVLPLKGALDRAKTLALAGLVGAGLLLTADRATAEIRTITVAGGCFWCVEADFEKVRGVTEAVSGFAGGTAADPSYKEVTKGGTGHLEVVQITYDDTVISARQLYDLFFRSIDPTDAGGQFCDRGESYATAIFASDRDTAAAQAAKAAAGRALGQTIVTPIRADAPFYPAEAYHQDFYKSSDRIVTRFGLRKKSDAYARYRDACGRDDRVKELWGADAPFVG